MQIQLQSKFKRQLEQEEDKRNQFTRPLQNVFLRQSRARAAEYYPDVRPSRMSYDAKDFAYRIPSIPESRDADYDRRIKSRSAQELQAMDDLQYPNSDRKRRGRYGLGCSFSRLTSRQFVQFLKTGILCGKRGHRVRFGMSGR